MDFFLSYASTTKNITQGSMFIYYKFKVSQDKRKHYYSTQSFPVA